MICSAKKILCLVPSEHKRHAVDQMLQGEISPQFPASVLRTQAQATLFLDVDSARELQQDLRKHHRESPLASPNSGGL
jgi:glucosamine-6-phosphate deaminase